MERVIRFLYSILDRLLKGPKEQQLAHEIQSQSQMYVIHFHIGRACQLIKLVESEFLKKQLRRITHF